MKDIQQLIKKDNQEGRYKDIFPESYTEAIRDRESGEFLNVILSRVNFLFLPYTINSAQTRLLVPSSMRRKALWLAYVKVDDTVVIEYYNSDDITDEAWQRDNNWISPLAGGGILPDIEEIIEEIEEWISNNITSLVKLNPDDLDRNDSKEIQLADRDSTNGMGYVILRKNKTFAEQVTKENTIYEIRYDYDLGEEVTIPANCTLKFNGGSISNGTLNGNNTAISGSPQYNILNDTIIKGFNLSYLDIRWFGAVSDFISTDEPGTDNSIYIKRALEASVNCAGVPILIEGRYRIGTTIETGYDINLIGRYNNNRTFVTDSDTYTNKVSLLYVDNCSAFKVIGRGSSTTKATNITVKNLYLRGSGTSSNSIFIEYSATGGPARVGYIAEVEVRSFNKFLYFYDDGSNQYGTLYGNLTIEKVVAYYNNQFIVSEASGNLVPTLCNLIIKDSNIEQNGERAIDLENLFGASIIDNCILEGQDYPIKVSIIGGSLKVTNNYFEANGGDYLVNINGKNVNNCFVRYENNYKLANANSNISITNVTILGYNTMNNDSSKLNFSGSYIEPNILHLLTTDSFESNINIREVNFYKLTDFDDNTAVLYFGQTKIERNLYGRLVDNSSFKLVAQASINVDVGDTIVLIFYRGTGNYLFNFYDLSGAPITENAQMTKYGRSGMDMIKVTISKATSTVCLYAQAASSTVSFGNGFVFKNPDAIRLSSIGIFPENSIKTTGIVPLYASTDGMKSSMFFSESTQTRGAYYSDGTDIRNSDGALFSKEEIVPDFIQYYSFLRANKTYKVVGDLDLNGTQVIVPEGCTIDFSRGGTISNGVLSLTNTRLLPQGLNLREYILEGVSITGKYKEGQIVYDSTIKKMKLWNGTAWVNLDGTALADTNAKEEIPASQDITY